MKGTVQIGHRSINRALPVSMYHLTPVLRLLLLLSPAYQFISAAQKQITNGEAQVLLKLEFFYYY